MKKLLTVLLAFVMLFSIGASAITLDTAESAAEVTGEETVAFVMDESALDIPANDPYYGELVYYNNFESGAGYAVGDNAADSTKYTHKTSTISGIRVQTGGSDVTLTIEKDPVDAESSNQALKVSPNKDSYTVAYYPQIYLDGGRIEAPGVYTFFVDIAAESGISKDFGIERRMTTEDGNATDGNFFKVNDSNRGKWNTAKFTVNLTHKDQDTTTSTHHYIYGIMLHSRHAANVTGLTDAHFYFDNIRVYFKPYPEYTMNATAGKTKTIGFGKDIDVEKCTFDAGNSEATVVFDAENKNCTVTSTGYAGLVTLNVAYTDGTTETRLVHLYAGNKWKPGLNVITGTTDPVDFENFRQADYNYAVANSGQIGKNPDFNGNASGRIAYVTSQFNYLTNAVDLSTPIELERTVYYSYYVKSNVGQYVVINGGSGNNLYTSPAASTSWVKRSFNITLANSKGGMSNNAWGTGIKSIGVGAQSGTFGYEDASKKYQYFDNIEFIPYYKATYRNWNDTADFNYQYFLKDSDGNLMTVYTPYHKNTLAAPWEGEGYKEFIGWSTTKGATEPMTSIPLEYDDIVLHPVYKDTTAVATNLVLSGGTGKTGGVFFNKKLNTDETTVNVGKTEATYAYNKANNCMVIAGAGYSGIVTINAVFFDGTTSTVEVQLIGGEKWRPGLNLITGTTDTFAVNSEYEAGLAFNFDPGTGVVADPFTGEGYALYLGGVANIRYPVITSKMTQQIEAGRSVLTVFDYSGKWNNFWIIGQPNVPFNDLTEALKRNPDKWTPVITSTAKAGKNFIVTRFQTDAGGDGKQGPLYLDNIGFIPYYKATYKNADGSELASEYFLRDSSGNIMTSYAPNKTAEWTDESKKFVGWAITEGGAVVDTVALANADVTFYPVFEDLNAVNYYGFDGEVVKTVYVDDGEYALDYVLADENGKYFEGWKVEGTEEAVSSVNVTANVNLYPVYTDKTESLETAEGQEMRFDGENTTASIRFKSSITAEEKNAADEFGFIVTRKTFLEKMAELAASNETLETELTFDFKYNGADLFVSGMAYQKDENGVVTVEKIVEETDDGNSVFAAVLTEIDNTVADQVNETMVVRPYVKFTKDGKQFTFYGATAENSLVGIAKTVDTTELPENVKASIEAIIALKK